MDQWEYQEREAREEEFAERKEAEAKGHDYHLLRRMKCINAKCEDGRVACRVNGMLFFRKCPACNRGKV